MYIAFYFCNMCKITYSVNICEAPLHVLFNVGQKLVDMCGEYVYIGVSSPTKGRRSCEVVIGDFSLRVWWRGSLTGETACGSFGHSLLQSPTAHTLLNKQENLNEDSNN